MNQLLVIAILFSISYFTTPAQAQSETNEQVTTSLQVLETSESYPWFEYTAYGYFTARQFDTFKTVQNLTPFTKREVDATEFAFEGQFHLHDRAAIEFEIEIEHGGTGTAREYDNFEEFGEFETETEKGGEIVLHEIYYKRKLGEDFEVKVGKAPLFISLSSILTSPKRHLNVQTSDAEVRMIPVGWTEIGLQTEKRFGPVKFGAAIINGLDSEFFNSPTWIGNGYQRQFENINADDLASLFNIEFGSIKEAQGFAIARYQGNTQNNRYKKDKLTVSANVTLVSALLNYKIGRFGIMGQSIWGTLENSDAVSAANNNMTNNVKPKQPNLGEKAILQTAQISYALTDDLTIYIQREHVNSFVEIRGNNFIDPRYDTEINSIGLSQWWDRYCFIKVQYGKEKTQLVGLPETTNLRIAFGFDLDK